MNSISENKEIITKTTENNSNINISNFDKTIKESNIKEENLKINNKENNIEKEENKLKINQIQNQIQTDLKENEENKNKETKEQREQKEKTEYTKKIGNYILFDQIGMGTFSKVTKAIHLITSQQVAVKILDKEKIEDEIDLERIIREIEILKNIHHPNIAQMYETYSTIHNFYLMMELVSGGDLFDFISEKSCLSENLSCHFFRQLISVLEYLISMGITHRDIKPENILLDENHESIKVIDFGLSNYCEDDELLGSSCGSPCYASPEMLSGNPYHGVKTDIWSAGVVLYSMLVGSLPFDDQELYNLYEQIKSGKFFLPSTLSLEAIDLLKRILQVDPKKRIGINDIKKHPWFNMEKTPMYRGINISKEKFPCNKDVVKFILNNYFSEDKVINFDMIVNMVETHACNKYTSTYYLTKINILGIDDECAILDENCNEGKDENKNNNNNIFKLININLEKNNKATLKINKEKSSNIFNSKERQLHKCKTKDSLDNNNYNKIKNKIFGLLNDEETNINYIMNLNKLNKKENTQIISKKNQYNLNENKKQNETNKNSYIYNNEKIENQKQENNKNQKIEKQDLINITTQNEVNTSKIKTSIINNMNKKEKVLNKRNNHKILYISNTDRNKLNIVNELKEDNYLSKNKNKSNYNAVFVKDNFNIFKFNIKDKKLKTKSINNSYNKSLLNDKNINTNTNVNSITTNNKKINSKNKSISSNNKTKNNSNINSNNNNLSEGYEKKQITFIKKNNTTNRLNEKKNLIQIKTPPKENAGHFNFYVINNIINKDKDFEDKKFSTLNYDNKAIIRGFTESNKIKSFVNKRMNNIAKNKTKESNHNFLSKIMKKKLAEKNIKRHSKLKTEHIAAPFSLKTQLKLRNQLKIKEDLNKIKVNLKPNNSDLYNNKSPTKTIITEINTYKKDLKKVFPKLKLEGISNKLKNLNQKNFTNEYNIPYNKIVIKNNYSCYTQNYINNNNNDYYNDNKSMLNDRSDSLSININKTNKIYKRRTKKKNCIISKNNLNQTKNISTLNEEIKKLTHQRYLSSALKTKLNNLKTDSNNILTNTNKISSMMKENISLNKKNKVLRNNNFNNQNNSYMNEYYAQNLKKRKSITKSEDNNVNSYIHKSMENENSINKKNNRKIEKRTSYLGVSTKYNINSDINGIKNNKNHISNRNSINSKINKIMKKECCINNNNQNVININMVLKHNKNKYKNRNFNSYLISNDSMTSTPVIYNTEQNINQSPYFTENFTESNEKKSFNFSSLKKNEKKK